MSVIEVWSDLQVSREERAIFHSLFGKSDFAKGKDIWKKGMKEMSDFAWWVTAG